MIHTVEVGGKRNYFELMMQHKIENAKFNSENLGPFKCFNWNNYWMQLVGKETVSNWFTA